MDLLRKLIFLTFFFFSIGGYCQNSLSLLRSIPSGATIYDKDKNELGTTPFDLNKLKKGVTEIRVMLDGYDPVDIEFSDREKKIAFPSTVIFCPMCNIEIDNAQAKDVYTGSLILRKKIKDHENLIMVAIDTPIIAINPELELGKVNSDRKYMKDKDIHVLLGYPENMQQSLINSFRESYLDAFFIATKEKERANLYKPKIVLKPIVKELSFTLKGKLLRDYIGPCHIECWWQVTDISDRNKTLATFDVKSSIFRLQGNYDLILHQMLSESERDLLDNDTLYDFLSKLEKNYLAKSKKEILKISAAQPVTYSDTKEMLKEISASVVTIENDEAFGSGSIISPDGYILTSYHVIDGEKNIFVKRGSNERIKAQVVRVNKDYDLALLKIEVQGLKPLSLGNSDKSDVGDEIFAAGTPLEKSLRQSITRGIISGYRQWNGVNFIQTDVSINAGNSGGPMLNSKGEIIGITTMKIIGRGVEGIGFGIPSNVIIDMLNLQLN